MSSTPSPAPPQHVQDQVVGRPLREHLRTWRPLLLAAGLLLLVALMTSWTHPPTSDTPLDTHNPHSDGAQALVALLRREGVDIEVASSWEEASSSVTQGTTLALLNAGALSVEQRETLSRSGADVVVVGALYQQLEGLSPIEASGVSAPDATVLRAQCQEEDALAAQRLESTRGSLSLDAEPDAVGCFPTDDGHYAYAAAALESGARLRVLAGSDLVTNAHLAREGNAALAVRALGHHERLIWFDAAQQDPATLWNTVAVPPWVPPLLAQLVVTVLALALVKGRAMGRIVREDLPVLVRATETTLGRGRLYRRAGDRAHAAAALREGSALRIGRRLGVPVSATRGELVAAAASAAQRPEALIDQVLYGPPPTSDQALADLAAQLDRLENEVPS